MHAQIKINGTALPSPTKVGITEEILWSSSTGRSVKTGEMLGAVVATKHTLDIEWTNITAADYKVIQNQLVAGFFGPVNYCSSDGNDIVNMARAYRSSFMDDDKGFVGGVHYYSSVKVSIIEK